MSTPDPSLPGREPGYAPPESFWQDFLSKYWEQQPTTLSYPARRPLMTEEEALALFRQLGDRFRAGEQVDADFYIENAYLRSGVGRLLPDATDRDLPGYRARVTAQLGGQRFSLVTNSVRRESREHSRRVHAFTRGLRRRIGEQAGSIGADIFLSSSLRTPFGVHRDAASNFSYIISGQKRMLVWPHEVFAERVDQHGPGPLNNVFLDEVDLDSYRDRAIVLEGRAGDVLYWPSSYWHIAESTGEPSLVLNVPVYLYTALYRMASEYYQRKLARLQRR